MLLYGLIRVEKKTYITSSIIVTCLQHGNLLRNIKTSRQRYKNRIVFARYIKLKKLKDGI